MPWTWDEVIADPQLQELPCKLELNADGELIMNAVRLVHSFQMYETPQHLQKLKSIGSTPKSFLCEQRMVCVLYTLSGSPRSAKH